MSGPRHSYEDAAVREIAEWPGVTHRLEIGGKHKRIYVCFRDAERFVVYPTSPSDAVRGVLYFLTDLRKELRAIGAQRVAQARRKPVERKRRHTTIERVTTAPEITDPRADGLASLRDLAERLERASKYPRLVRTVRNPLLPLAIALVKQGRSFSEAAAEVGGGLTRNAVAGACHRAGVRSQFTERKRRKCLSALSAKGAPSTQHRS